MKKLGLLFILLISGCCQDNDADCTQNELIDKKAQQESEHKLETTPELVSIQDGVRLYRIWTFEPHAKDHWTYFTTPCGDVSSVVEWQEQHGKTSSTESIRAGSSGSGCK